MADSELRQRRGDTDVDDKDAEIARLKAALASADAQKVSADTLQTTSPAADTVATRDDAATREDMVKDIQERLIKSVKPDVKPGISNAVKTAKDALQKDPMNLQLIFELGHAYATDDQWDRSVNVMMRGFKRMNEVEDHMARFEFLMILCQGSLKIRKYKQAFAVLSDMEEPSDEKAMAGYLVMSCQVYGQNGDMTRCLKAFNKAIDGDDVESMFGVWAACIAALKKVRAFDAAKSSLDMKMSTDEQRSKMEALEKLAEIRMQMEDAVHTPPLQGSMKYVYFALLVTLLLIFTGMLYKLEAWSLANIKKNPK